jgi:endonuclease/exonuclease/phosphatase family metal-dependent hydrolase
VNLGEVETLFANDSYAFPRPMLKARVRSVQNPEHDFVFGVVHLKAMLDSESLARRRDACEKLDLWVRTAAQNGVESEFVLAGDWNAELTESPQYNAFGPLLTLAESRFLTLTLEQEGGFSYLPFESFIDHVFVFGDAAIGSSDAQVVTANEFVPSYEANVSDHLPVLATLRFAR